MEPLTILLWILCFLVFLLAQSLLINGFKTAMDGETEILPNGKPKHSEMIFYPFYRWLTQMKTPAKKRIYYEGTQFRDLMLKLQYVYKQIIPEWDEEKKSSYLQLQTDLEVENMKKFEPILKREQSILVDIDGRQVRFYKEYDNYRFHYYVRKPLGQCIKCMASVYSIIPFWSVALYCVGWNWLLIPVYCANVICLAYLNYLIYKK